ncbi:MAG: hypothetical protein K0U41_06450 [Gammaproteobacteria bacterium]|nr:hypothetical protein [Gammaproteobacteria bacterium]
MTDTHSTLKIPATVTVDGKILRVNLVCPNGKTWGTSVSLSDGAAAYLTNRINAFNTIDEHLITDPPLLEDKT